MKPNDGIQPISAKILRNPDSDLSLKIGRKKRKYSNIRSDLYGGANFSKKPLESDEDDQRMSDMDSSSNSSSSSRNSSSSSSNSSDREIEESRQDLINQLRQIEKQSKKSD